jgi:hypothetical protein
MTFVNLIYKQLGKPGKPMKQIFTGLSIIGALVVLALSVGCATTPQEIKQQSYNPPVFPG